MAEDKGSKVPLKGGAPIPKMHPVQGQDKVKKGAPIPNMQPAPSTQHSQDTGQSCGDQPIDGGSSGGSDSGGGGESKE